MSDRPLPEFSAGVAVFRVLPAGLFFGCEAKKSCRQGVRLRIIATFVSAKVLAGDSLHEIKWESGENPEQFPLL
jgi:hypothetical protein